jgi:hypothetical protein
MLKTRSSLLSQWDPDPMLVLCQSAHQQVEAMAVQHSAHDDVHHVVLVVEELQVVVGDQLLGPKETRSVVAPLDPLGSKETRSVVGPLDPLGPKETRSVVGSNEIRTESLKRIVDVHGYNQQEMENSSDTDVCLLSQNGYGEKQSFFALQQNAATVLNFLIYNIEIVNISIFYYNFLFCHNLLKNIKFIKI